MFTRVFKGLGPAAPLSSAEVFGCFRLMTVNEEVGRSGKPCAANAEVRVHSEDKGLKSEWRHIPTCGSSFPEPNVFSDTEASSGRLAAALPQKSPH